GFFYGAQKNFPNPEKHVFLDVGAGSTIASLISFSSLKKLKTMEVKHVGYDVELGGNWIDGLLFSFLEGKFKEQHPDLTVNFKSDPAVHYLLNKEATRVKEILSLNTDVNVVLENIYKGRTLKTKVSRDEFNTLLTPHKERFLRPLNEILISNPDLVGENATLNSLVLVGGSTRVPLLQSWIAELIGKGKIASNVNSDEAPSLGAVLYAAKLTPGYRVGAINLLDTLPYNIQMNKSILFLENSETFPKTKSVTLKKASFQSMEILTRDNEVLGTAQFGPFNESASQLNVKVFVNQNGVLSLLNATQLTETSSFFSGKSNLTSPVDFNWTVVIPPMDKTAIEKSRTRLNVWKNKENDIRFREQTMNDFVTLVYELSSRMDERVIVRLTTEEERSKVMQKQSEMLSWLEEHSSSATLPQLQAQFLALKESIKDVMTRKTQWVSGVNSLHEYAEELKDTSLESWVADEEAKEKYNLDILQAKVTEVHAKVLEKREQERIQREKERLAKEEEERKAREKILEEVKKKLEAQKLEKEAAEKKTSHEKVNNATTSSNPTTTNTAGESPESDAADILPSSDAEIQVEPIQTDEDPIREDL
ncbi:lumenal Hsp70 protein, partial [Coelomomyces lativittatus]